MVHDKAQTPSDSVRSTNSESVTKIDPVIFERILSYRPQITDDHLGSEPPLRDIIFSYYFRHCSEEDSDRFTKQFTDELYRMIGGK